MRFYCVLSPWCPRSPTVGCTTPGLVVLVHVIVGSDVAVMATRCRNGAMKLCIPAYVGLSLLEVGLLAMGGVAWLAGARLSLVSFAVTWPVLIGVIAGQFVIALVGIVMGMRAMAAEARHFIAFPALVSEGSGYAVGD